MTFSYHFKPLVFAIFILFPVIEANACTIRWKDAAEQQAEASVAATAVILSASKPKQSFRGEEYDYKINIETVERGELKLGELQVSYEDLKAHLRGTMQVCPLKNGSGIEHKLEPGVRYKLFLRSALEPQILFAESLGL